MHANNQTSNFEGNENQSKKKEEENKKREEIRLILPISCDGKRTQ
jgi:hypothetical protein